MADLHSFDAHPQYYLEDGNILLLFEDRILFRVYRGHLARHSQVFADMSAMCVRPASASSSGRPGKITLEADQEYIDGVPLLRLEDKAPDFAYLLDVLMGITPAAPSFDMLEGVLRIATKYLFDEVRAWAVRDLRRRFPRGVEDLLADPNLDVYGDRVLAARVVSLARNFDLPELIPLAFYALLSYNYGHPPVPASPLFSVTSFPTPPPISKALDALQTIHSILSEADNARWTMGRQQLNEVAVSYLFQLREYGLMKITCSRKVGTFHRTCAAGNVHGVWSSPQPPMAEFIRNPLGVMAQEAKGYDYSTMCGDCNAAGQAKHIDLVGELYARLPEVLLLNDSSYNHPNVPSAFEPMSDI